MMYKSYSELGYYSIALLPATSIIIDSFGILGDKESRNIHDEKSISQHIANKLGFLAIGPGEKISNIIYSLLSTSSSAIQSLMPTKVQKVLTKSVNNSMGLGLQKRTTTTEKEKESNLSGFSNSFLKALSYYLAAVIIESFLEHSVTASLIILAFSMFASLFISKVIFFLASYFVVFFAFGHNQLQHFSKYAIKLIQLSLKSVFLVVAIFMSIFILSIIENFGIIILEFFASDIEKVSSDLINIEFSFNYILQIIKSWISNLMLTTTITVLMTLFKLYIVYYVIIKSSSEFWHFVGVDDKLDNFASSIAEKVDKQETNHNKL